MEERQVYTVYIGETDPYEWTMSTGKNILMPIIFKTCQEMFDEGVSEKQALRVESVIRNTPKAFDFWVKKENVEDTLQKVMDWALEEEEYEMCRDISNLRERLQDENSSYR